MTFGELVKQKRKEMGMTQKELAKKIGCTRLSIIRYEQGRSIPRADITIATAQVLNVQQGDLFRLISEHGLTASRP